MKQLLVLVLAVSGSAASAQTPTTNPMPDGSRDMYAGLGVVSAPRYEGADSRKVSALPVLQVQWSNGLFISGLSAGMHLSDRPTVEYGPLLTLHPGRDESGSGRGIGVVEMSGLPSLVARAARGNPLSGMDDIRYRLEGGGFFNYYLAPQWRLTSSVVVGSGHDRDGARMDLGVQRLAAQVAPHHTLSFSAGVSVVNRAYNQSYFGVTEAESFASGHPEYRPGGGLKDVRLGARWNWTLSPSWMLTTHVQATRLVGNARTSPLAERPTNVTVSTALAYRF
ncbi:MipA/OmpV family protein [Massilia niastensis]|uniref:MipA/OmpV family protein n=1 Tax=Massilia niastensis TaxID=544911 RepID=UPI00037CDAA2|nr:MipA/OmpV family protein [Massilia niastensis]